MFITMLFEQLLLLIASLAWK